MASSSPREELVAGRILKEIRERLHFLNDVGVGYLTLGRSAVTLSGGEGQRIRLATQIGSSLSGVLYVLDEPSIGLHQRDNRRLLQTLERLRDLGNTVLVVEHDEETIRTADYIVDLGPGAGEHGGELLFQGTPAEAARRQRGRASVTGEYLRGEKTIVVEPRTRRAATRGAIEIIGARRTTCRISNVTFPLGVFIAITGVSGSGKSTLVNDILYKRLAKELYRATDQPGDHDRIDGLQHIDKVIQIDQSPIGRTPRSNPATYIGLFTFIRDLFAMLPESRQRGYKPGRFSFNVKGGRCEACQGDGVMAIEMHFLPDVYVTCEQCKGRRYNRETLEVRYRGKSIADLLELTVDQALPAARELSVDCQQAADAAAGGPRLSRTGAVRHDAERRRGAARQARQGTVAPRHRAHALHPRRADHRPALRGRRQTFGCPAPIGRTGQHDRGHRAQPRRRPVGRPRHRPRSRGRQRGGRVVAQGPPEPRGRAQGSHTGAFPRRTPRGADHSQAGRSRDVSVVA